MSQRKFVIERRLSEEAQSGCAPGVVLGVGMLIVTIGAGVAIYVEAPLTFSRVIGLALLAALAAAAVWVLHISLQNFLAGKRLGKVDFEVSARGSSGLEAAVAFAPPGGIRLERLVVAVRCAQGLGADSASEPIEFVHTLAEDQTLYGGEPVSRSTFFELPDDVPFSNDNGDDYAAWSIDLTIGIFRFPDHFESLRFQIVPPDAPDSFDVLVGELPGVNDDRA
jgi:hypothetical protein